MTMLDLLARWNRWGSATLASGHRREVESQIESWLDRKEVIVTNRGMASPLRTIHTERPWRCGQMGS